MKVEANKKSGKIDESFRYIDKVTVHAIDYTEDSSLIPVVS